MTQYCQGVAQGAMSCPAGSRGHVSYPAGGALAGVWADESRAAPGQATGHQLGAEAVAAAAHFGNKTPASNRDAQYVILSPTGTHPDGFDTASGSFCAWHDWNGDGALTGGPARSAVGDVAFINLPYLTDAGPACGQNFVNAGPAGLLDGVSIVGGHEYAEVITDQNPAGGWIDPAGNEAADLCAWNAGPGARSADLTFSTGTFAMQPIWANDGGRCELRHAIAGNGGSGRDIVTVTSPGARRADVGRALSLQIRARDSAAGQTLRYSATGLPPGLRIRASSGLISGTPTAAGRYT